MYKARMYVLMEVMKHNIDVFSTQTYFWKACEINSSVVSLKFLSMQDCLLQKNSKHKFFISLINPLSGIKYLNDRDS